MKTDLHNLQDVKEGCDTSSSEITEKLSEHKAANENKRNIFLNQIHVDKETLMTQSLESNNNIKSGLSLLNNFLQQELKLDVSTGT